MEIDFSTDGSSEIHRLFYFSVNMADERLRDNAGFLTFVAKLKPSTTYFKATSYMIHKTEFSVIRNHVLANSAAILQDDSGIPYRFFAGPRWRVALLSDYEKPYGSFRWLEQADLRKAYGGVDKKPLAFNIGYGFYRIPSNLLLATCTGLN